MYRPHRHKVAPGLEKFYVITPIFNPVRYKSRYELYHRFKRHVEKSDGQLLTIEAALGDRSFEVTTTGDPLQIQVRSWDELWIKENLINLAISRLPSDWEYVAWVDGDVEFLREDWVEETVHLLQHYQLIQMFQDAIDMGPEGDVLQVHKGFVWSWINGVPKVKNQNGYYSYGHWHPGFAWAARREAIDHLGGLYETAILGAADHHMAHALIGRVLEESPENLSMGYRRTLLEWQDRATKHIREDIGFMHGSIQHHFHGPKKARRYGERWSIIHKHGFDPDIHLKKDWQGVLQFTDAGIALRNDIRAYFRGRNEDSIEQ